MSSSAGRIAILVAITMSAAARTPDAVRPLPAGPYFRDYRDACTGCAEPRYAVVAGVVDTLDGAERLASSVTADDLPHGYPLIMHTSQLGLEASPSGIKVIAGLFENRRDALSWVARHGAWPDGVRVVRLLTLAQFDRSPWAHEAEAYVVEIDRTRARVPAYRTDRPARPDDGSSRHVMSNRTPLCFVGAGERFVRTPAETWSTIGFDEHGWLGVPCGDGVGYVRITDTLFRATIRRLDDGTYRLRQVVAVECDVPTILEWRYDATGRVGEPARVDRRGNVCESPCSGENTCDRRCGASESRLFEA